MIGQDYHRNFDIENFNDTISYLIDRDYFVIELDPWLKKIKVN